MAALSSSETSSSFDYYGQSEGGHSSKAEFVSCKPCLAGSAAASGAEGAGISISTRYHMLQKQQKLKAARDLIRGTEQPTEKSTSSRESPTKDQVNKMLTKRSIQGRMMEFDFFLQHPDWNIKRRVHESELTARSLGVKASEISSPDLGVDVGSDPFSSLERPPVPTHEG